MIINAKELYQAQYGYYVATDKGILESNNYKEIIRLTVTEKDKKLVVEIFNTIKCPFSDAISSDDLIDLSKSILSKEEFLVLMDNLENNPKNVERIKKLIKENN